MLEEILDIKDFNSEVHILLLNLIEIRIHSHKFQITQIYKTEKEFIKCPICGMSKGTYGAMNVHLQKEHPGQPLMRGKPDHK